MGLSISRSILQNHGGRLWATANDGPGTTFHFSLPRYRQRDHMQKLRALLASDGFDKPKAHDHAEESR